MLSPKAQNALNDAMRAIGTEGFLFAGFIMKDGELEAILDNVPGGLQTNHMRSLLYQVREALKEGSGCQVEQKDLDAHLEEKQEMN